MDEERELTVGMLDHDTLEMIRDYPVAAGTDTISEMASELIARLYAIPGAVLEAQAQPDYSEMLGRIATALEALAGCVEDGQLNRSPQNW